MKDPKVSEFDSSKLSYLNIIEGNMSPWVMRFIKDVGKVVYDERPSELDGEIDKVNKLLQDINIDWKIIL